MKKTMKMIVAAIAIACAGVTYGHHRHHHSYWGRGGSNFWPGFAGGLVGSMIWRPLPPPPPPVVVQPPVVVPAPAPVVVPTPVVVPQPAPVVVPAPAPFTRTVIFR